MNCFNVSIYINDGQINIAQESDYSCKPDAIILSKDQIDLVCQWLNEAKKSLED